MKSHEAPKESMYVKEYEENGDRRYTGPAHCGWDDNGKRTTVQVGSGRKPGIKGTLAATSEGWTDTSILWIP